jgi:hypothetical protein
MRNIETLIQSIEVFIPVDDNWEALDELIEEICALKDERAISPLLGLLERYPEQDGYGVFWGIVHGLEAIGGYETKLVASVLSKPHEFSVLMLNRIINSGTKIIADRSVLDILKEISNNNSFTESIREDANEFISYQQETM